MVNRGRAVVVKKGKYKDVWVDDDGYQVSPPSSPGWEKENGHQPVLPQNLSSEAPSPKTRQVSQSAQQSAARRDHLAHLFDDDNTNAEEQLQPVTSVKRTTALPLSALLNSVPLQQQQASVRESQSTTAAEELPISPKPASKKKAHASQSAPLSQGTLPHPASNAAPVQPTEQPEATDMANANSFIPTNQHRHMRACMVCSIVRTEQQFKTQGCPNCESFLALRGNADGVAECTSQVFEGLMTVSDTSKSWVARWQRLEGYVPGVYAVQVEGSLPDEVIAAVEDAGVHYIPRDGSVNEALPTDS
ncbi:Spt4-domain-containing protein [Karstenula rhodostoma CBS 690.94]|uniref:Transcription elongation factor SPT4 n=1 Tax=Karstenula rhodostoma CBS 690.94 TaxID=1392251 RepID=A0A9P4PHL9_9PLEO|nr:Spt4-domain-containing protein [Karstenula rhodostoma CBS 690.94]